MNTTTRRILYIGLYILLTLHLITVIHTYSSKNPLDADEISWFYHTHYFDLIKKGKFFDPSWQSLDAYDHPPLSKYIYGFYLNLYFGNVDSKRNELRETYGSWSEVDFSTVDMNQTFAPFISRMRETSSASVVLLVLILSLYAFYLTKNIGIALLYGLWMGHHDAFLNEMLRAVSDSHYLLLLSLSFAVFLLYLKERKNMLLVASSILGALSFSSKLTGVLYFFIIPVYLCIETLFRKINSTLLLTSLFIVGLTGAYTWFVLNPTLYPSPVYNTYWFFLMRKSIMEFQMNEAYHLPDLLLTVQDKTAALWCTLFHFSSSGNCFNWNITTSVYANVIVFASGCGLLIRRIVVHKDRAALFTFISMCLTVFFIMWHMSLNWGRYYLPIFILFSVIFTYGLNGLLLSVVNLTRILRKRSGITYSARV